MSSLPKGRAAVQSSPAAAAAAAAVAVAPPPVRHGVARLQMHIGDDVYALRPWAMPGMRSARGWHVRVVRHPHRVGTVYMAGYAAGVGHRCSCPDSVQNGARCKHIGALVALGLLPKGKGARRGATN